KWLEKTMLGKQLHPFPFRSPPDRPRYTGCFHTLQAQFIRPAWVLLRVDPGIYCCCTRCYPVATQQPCVFGNLEGIIQIAAHHCREGLVMLDSAASSPRLKRMLGFGLYSLVMLPVSFLILAYAGKPGSQSGPEPGSPKRWPAVAPFLSMPPCPPSKWVAAPAFPFLKFQSPVFLTCAPHSHRLFVCEREGTIRSFDNNPAATSAPVFLDIRSRCQGFDDCGLLGLAFHPEFGQSGSPNRGFFYISYQHSTAPTEGPERPKPWLTARNRLARFTVPDGSDVADPDSELVLIDQEDRSLWHNGGAIFFGPQDGFLYVSLGDEGGLDDECHNTQRIDRNLFSGVIRIDVNKDPARSHPILRQPISGKTAEYFIPNDNPFVGVPGALEEFWCIGLRSPHTMTCDPVTGRIWSGDVGDCGGDSREEINLIEKGGNYQWNYAEGTAQKHPRPPSIIGVEKPPVYEYSRMSGNNCVIGGYVYRGETHATELGGMYIFGDNASGRIWALAYREGRPVETIPLTSLPATARYYEGLSSFGVDDRGELYLCVLGRPDKPSGAILKLERATSPAGLPVPSVLSQSLSGEFSHEIRGPW
ncbi:MAG: PQQ-dependent sugar dehydrogenase, partial [Gemmataceae bacterium]|nr:PQQ-dependent sugar dehydrogenase [Gemmataceae bacterium]